MSQKNANSKEKDEKTKPKCIILKIVEDPNKEMGPAYQKYLNCNIGFPIDEIHGIPDNDLQNGTIVNVNMGVVGGYKINVFAEVIDSKIHYMDPRFIIVSLFYLYYYSNHLI
jgi:hypothetical protein